MTARVFTGVLLLGCMLTAVWLLGVRGRCDVNAQAQSQVQATQTTAEAEAGLRLDRHGNVWNVELDRFYMKNIMLPYAGKLAGTGGKVLDVGYAQFNADDRRMAGISAAHWYFVDPSPDSSNIGDAGNLIVAKMQEVTALKPALRRSFRVIIDYGVVGWIMCQNVTACHAHIDHFWPLLDSGGVLLLKWDCKSSEQIDWWAAARPRLERHFKLVKVEAVHAGPCDQTHLMRFQNIAGDSDYLKHYHKGFRTDKCQAYLMMEWHLHRKVKVGT